jgi:hypothetical protein
LTNATLEIVAMTAIEKTAPPKIRSLPLDNLVLQSAGMVHSDWYATPEPGTPFERLLEGDFWALHAKKLRRLARIHVVDDAEGYVAELIVRDGGAYHTQMSVLRKVALPKLNASDAESLPLGYSVTFLGPEKLWAAQRTNGDGAVQVLRSGFVSKARAMDHVIGLGMSAVK